jgi:hypothetical protein
MVEKEEDDKLRIEVVFDSPNYGQVACLISLMDNVAIARFSDNRLARDMFNKESELGNKNQRFNERLKCIIEKYPGKLKEDIAKELIEKFEKHNVEIKSRPDTK